MQGWRTHTGLAVALPLENIDTDQLIPARFMSTPRAEGYGRFLLHDLRRDQTGALRPDFPLNRHPTADILITRRNFGSGSSREAAVYALVDAGIRAVLAPGFGDIFAANAVNNGLLPARLDEKTTETLIARLENGPLPCEIDLDTATLRVGEETHGFFLAETERAKLINGWDDIDLTRADSAQIAEYRESRQKAAPWAWPERPRKGPEF